MSHKPKREASAKETVLLRQAVPKYNFTGRKLPKESNKNVGSGPEAAHSIASPKELTETEFKPTLSHGHPVTNFSVQADSKKPKPIAVVGASLQLPQTTETGNSKIDISPVQSTQALSTLNGLPRYSSTQSLSSATTNNDSDRNGRQNIPAERISVNPPVGAPHCTSSPNMPLDQLTTAGHQPSTNAFPAVTQTTAGQTFTVLPTILQSDPVTLTPYEYEYFRQLENERDKLKKDLEVQLQVNSELKRLLVASVGDDLSQRVERLCRDRAQLSLDLGGYSKKMSEEYENLDKVSIQADMWRSKYLASRVMNEELGNARAFYALQCHDSQDALQQLLNERHELRTNLLEMHRVLQQMKNAFDPLNSQRSSTLKSTNVLDLSRSCQQLAEAMRFRLLPAHVAISIDVEADDSVWADSVTRAEQFANEVLSRPAEPPGSLQSGSSRLLPLTTPPDSQVTRFHPHTRHENLTYNCCAHCKGEINVL